MKQNIDQRNGVWVTPRSFFDPLCKEFQIDTDAAASADDTMLPHFWDQKKDAFEQDWSRWRVWCNPPYTRQVIYRWVKQCATSGAKICVALLPARTDTRWFHDFIYNKPGVEIRFVKGRIKFSGMSGAGKFPSMVVIFNAPLPVVKG